MKQRWAPSVPPRMALLMTGMPAVALMLASLYLCSKPGRGFAFLSGVALALAVQMRFTALFLGGYFLLLLALEPRRWREFGYLALGAVLTIVGMRYLQPDVPDVHSMPVIEHPSGDGDGGAEDAASDADSERG